MEIIEDTEAQAHAERMMKLQAFCGVISEKRKEAVDYRKLSGFDEETATDYDYYNGEDELNKREYTKPETSEGRLLHTESKKNSIRSTVFLNITQPYVDMGAARAAEMLLPTDDMPFAGEPTPIPEMDAQAKNDNIMGEAAKAYLAKAKAKMELAETQIWDWLVESSYHDEMRKVIDQNALCGTGCLKGPFPELRKKRKVVKTEFGIKIEILEEKKPASRMIDIRNIYPDPACGENIHNGSYIFEKDVISARQLVKLKGTGYLDEEIDEIIKEGPNKKYITQDGKTLEKDSFEIWHFTGYASHDELQACNCPCEEGESLPVLVSMINDRIIKASIAVLDSGDFPYEIMNWQRQSGHWWGVGIARQVRTAQNMLNASARALLDNAGISAGPQIVLKNGVIRPQNGVWTLEPMKIWLANEDADIGDVKDAFHAFIIPSLQVELMNIIKLALEFAEKATSMPLLMEGRQGAQPETAQGRLLMQNNANTVLRRIVKFFDNLIESHVSKYYEWLMIHSDNDEAKGDFNFVAKGSSAFYERDIQNQAIMQLIPFAQDAKYELNPKKLMTEILKMNKINPERVSYSPEELEELKKQPQPQDPSLAVAQLKAQAEMEKTKLVQDSDMIELDKKAEAMQHEFALKLHMQELEQEHQERMKQMELNIKIAELAQNQQISIESIKAALASDVMKLGVQKELSAMNHVAKQVSTPETEPAGLAPPGEAYQK